MSTQPNAASEPRLDAQANAPAAISPVRSFYWSVRRELWEYRSIYLAPLAVAVVFLFGFLISLIHLVSQMRALALDTSQELEALETPYNIATGLIMATALLIEIFYCVEALYGERRDRSIMFWKSLPVSDLTAVLAKASVPLMILPVVALAITVATYFCMLVVNSAILGIAGLSVGPIWTHLGLSQKLLALTYHLVTAHVLWYAPVYAWLLLVSGWVRRVPFLWAVLPPLAIVALEKILFNTSHFASLIDMNGPQKFVFPTHADMPMDWMENLALGQFLSTPALWVRLVVTAALLGATARMRRYRGPI